MKKKLLFAMIAVIASLTANSQQKGVLWSEDFEGDWTVNWHVDAGTWEVGVPASGPGAAHGGQKLAATVLAGNYAEPVSSRLIRHTSFVVPAASENPRLRFWYWFSFAAGDGGQVQIKVNNGEWESISNTLDNYGSNAWSYGSIDLSTYAGSSVQIGFYFYSNNSGGGSNDVSSGWYIDDIALITGPYTLNNPETFESGFGDWSVDEGSWEVGIPTIGPATSHSGQNCAGTYLSGSYQEPAASRLVSPPFVVPSTSTDPAIRFWHWFSFADGDGGEVQITTDGGKNWESISSQFINTSSGIWTPFHIYLSPFMNKEVQIGFFFYSNNYGGGSNDVSSGWYIDDINFDNITWTKENFKQDINVYPNPFSDRTVIDLADIDISGYKLSIYNISGRKVLEMDQIQSGRIELERGNLPAGIYIIELKGDKVYRNKIIVK
jgi:hypothetical protein